MVDPGWLGVVALAIAPLPQLLKIWSTRSVTGVAVWTYALVVVGVICYEIHAILIKDAVFITSNAINLTLNGTILALLIKGKRRKV